VVWAPALAAKKAGVAEAEENTSRAVVEASSLSFSPITEPGDRLDLVELVAQVYFGVKPLLELVDLQAEKTIDVRSNVELVGVQPAHPELAENLQHQLLVCEEETGRRVLALNPAPLLFFFPFFTCTEEGDPFFCVVYKTLFSEEGLALALDGPRALRRQVERRRLL
jgi:hypothetical protein